ncbi:hypothetical protein LCGC14_1222490 [marine sediment metagenome]|uniref:Uncharacterized protein n=1 Tax=marine sediment metagenome TaxID=412755 RepID=A0A0F9LY19_9ZZZZ
MSVSLPKWLKVFGRSGLRMRASQGERIGMKGVIAIAGLLLLTVGCGLERPTLALIVPGVILLLVGVAGYLIGMWSPRRGRK